MTSVKGTADGVFPSLGSILFYRGSSELLQTVGCDKTSDNVCDNKFYKTWQTSYFVLFTEVEPVTIFVSLQDIKKVGNFEFLVIFF